MPYDKAVYILLRIVCYQDFETHYETEVIGVFTDPDEALKHKTELTLKYINENHGYGPYDADECDYIFDVKPMELNKIMEV